MTTTTTIARAWLIVRGDGVRLGFTDHDDVLEFEATQFRPDSGLSARALVHAVGLSVDNTEAEGALTHDSITEADLIAGRWDAAQLQMWEVDWSDTAKRRLIFSGSIGEVSRKNGAFRAELRGLSEPLNRPGGRVYHPRCSASLGDRACRVNLDQPHLCVEAVVSLVENGRTVLVETNLAFRPRWFEHGTMRVLTGAAEGISATIKHDEIVGNGRRRVELWAPPGALLLVGDRVQMLAGCDKSALCCRRKFDNFMNFRGFPHLPGEDWLMAPAVERRRRDVTPSQAKDLEALFGGQANGDN